MAAHTWARAIDTAFARFLRSPAAKGATQPELDALCCWQWEPGYVPRPAELANMLDAIRLGASGRMSIAGGAETVDT